MIPGELAEQRTPDRGVPVQLQVGQPVGGLDQRCTLAHGGVGNPDRVVRRAKADFLSLPELSRGGLVRIAAGVAMDGLRRRGPVEIGLGKPTGNLGATLAGFSRQFKPIETDNQVPRRVGAVRFSVGPGPGLGHHPVGGQIGMGSQSPQSAQANAFRIQALSVQPLLKGRLVRQIAAIEQNLLQGGTDFVQSRNRQIGTVQLIGNSVTIDL